MLDPSQIAQYLRDGYLILRNQFDDREIDVFETAYKRHPWDASGPAGCAYPEPARYTLACNCMADGDLATIAEDPRVIEPVTTLLGDEPQLSTFVVYDRTPGGPGLPKHNDYKRWRPVGSSMNWLFAIVPFTDYDASAGPLYVAPGSHRLERVRDIGERVMHVDPAVVPDDEAFMDPQLKRGDLLLMNMHLWHKAAPNNSNRTRAGFFNKFTARSCPPATGYYIYDNAAYEALSDAGKRLVAVHSDKPVVSTRLVLERAGANGPEFMMMRNPQGRLELPGGPAFAETAIAEWDRGNFIGALYDGVARQLDLQVPWVTYVGDYEERDGLSRVYAYAMNEHGFPRPYTGEWLSLDDVRGGDAAFGYESAALQDWQMPGITRGKGVTQAQARVDQYAY